LRAELEHVGGSSSVHDMPFDLPYTHFTVHALTTCLLPVVFVPLQAVASTARLLLRTSSRSALSDDDDAYEADASEEDITVVNVTGKGCRGLLSISHSSDTLDPKAENVENMRESEKRINVRNRVGVPLPFVVAQSGGGAVLPRNGCIPAYGSVTLVASDDGGGGRGCGASICVVHELLERSFKSALLV
jgi:hypothetical protein